MSNLESVSTSETCESPPEAGVAFDALPGRRARLGELSIRRLLPRSRRRLVGPWCFLDAFGPMRFDAGTPMDVPPHPHIGLQTVSWLLEGEVLHHDSLGFEGRAEPGVLNLMTAGRGIAHAERTPEASSGKLHGVQLWVALPDASRDAEPAFEQHRDLPVLSVGEAQATVFLGRLGDARSLGRTFSPLVGADVAVAPAGAALLPLEPDFEHAFVPLVGALELEGRELDVGTLYDLGRNRRELSLRSGAAGARALLIGGAPFGETVLMWWNFVARTESEIESALEDWRAGRRFGDVTGYPGPRLPAPDFAPRS